MPGLIGLKLLHGFIKLSSLCISRPLPNKTKLKFEFESKYSMPWLHCVCGQHMAITEDEEVEDMILLRVGILCIIPWATCL